MAAKQKQSAGKAGSKAKPSSATAKSRKKETGTIMLTTLAIGAAGVLGILGWQYIKKRKQKNSPNLDETLLKSQSGNTPSGPFTDILSPLPGNTATSPYVPDSISPVIIPSNGNGDKKNSASASDDFPLKRGSKGENVRQLQEALIGKYGSKTLPKYGADGSFGAEMVAALKKVKLPATISETLFNVLVQGNASTGTETTGTTLSVLAQGIYNAILKRDFTTVLSLLKSIKSSDDYSTVSTAFKEYRINGVRQTLVNGLLNVFSTNTQKEQLRLAFARMGLTYDGNKWSLSGINGIPIITIIPTKVWVSPNTAVKVPARMVLGHEVTRRLQYVLFVNGGRHFLVHSDCIKHL